jgi:PBP1b-binding outer membrane lipoprotein LpoB
LLHKTSQTISIATLIIFFSGCLDKPSTIEETPFQQSSALMRAAVSAVIINNDYASLKNGALDILVSGNRRTVIDSLDRNTDVIDLTYDTYVTW